MVVRTEAGGRVLVRLINAATATAFWIDLGDASGTAVAVDGNPIVPRAGSRFPLAQGQRLDLEVIVPAGAVVAVLAQREGDRPRTGIVLAAPGAVVGKIAGVAAEPAAPADLSLETALSAAEAVSDRAADVAYVTMLSGGMAPYVWTIDGATWATRRPLAVRQGQRVIVEIMNHSMMAHPMHLHGHHFRVVAINGTAINGAVRDTVLVPPMSRVALAFDAENPGRWLFHCHNLYHMATGMMTELTYAGTA
jgi:FtsP/CotA-like multicopper oxidase with cupredoxin domain